MGLFRPFIPKLVNLGERFQTALDQLVLTFQIEEVERREENIVLVNSEKVEVRKKDFIFQNQKIERI